MNGREKPVCHNIDKPEENRFMLQFCESEKSLTCLSIEPCSEARSSVFTQF